jgi:hypothetical protein
VSKRFFEVRLRHGVTNSECPPGLYWDQIETQWTLTQAYTDKDGKSVSKDTVLGYYDCGTPKRPESWAPWRTAVGAVNGLQRFFDHGEERPWLMTPTEIGRSRIECRFDMSILLDKPGQMSASDLAVILRDLLARASGAVTAWTATSDQLETVRCCASAPCKALHLTGQAVDTEHPTEAIARAFLRAASDAGMYGVQDGTHVHIQTAPLVAEVAKFSVDPSALVKEREDIWARALELAKRVTKYDYTPRQPRGYYSGCGGSPGQRTMTKMVEVPEGAFEWLLHEVGHWVASDDEDRARPNYGLDGEDDGIGPKREWQAWAFEEIVLAPFGNARLLAAPSCRDGVGFSKPGPIDDTHHRHIDRRVRDSKVDIEEWRALAGDWYRWGAGRRPGGAPWEAQS